MSELISQESSDDAMDLRSLAEDTPAETAIIEDVTEISVSAVEPITHAESEPVTETIAPIAADTSKPETVIELESVVSTPVETVAEAPLSQPEPVATVVSEPVIEKAVVAPTANAKPETSSAILSNKIAQADDDTHYPSLELRVFTVLRDGFVKIFDIILTVIAIIVERIAALNWSGYWQAILSILATSHQFLQNRLPKTYRMALYGVLALLIMGIPISIGAMQFLPNNNANAPLSASSQTVTISQNTAPIIDNGILAPLFTPTVQQWAADIAVWTAGTDISPDMLAIVMQLESCGNPTVEGGLFGIPTASNTLNDTDEQASIALGKLQSGMARTDGNFGMALALYADGERVLTDDFGLWSFHARDMFILGRIMQRQAQAGATSSDDLNSWLQNSGAILCTQAQTTRNN